MGGTLVSNRSGKKKNGDKKPIILSYLYTLISIQNDREERIQ